MIASGNRNARVQLTGPADMQRLATEFNRMVDELERSIDAETQSAQRTRRFVDDAAHELRTPTTAIGAYAELLVAKPDRSGEAAAQIAHGIVVETDRLRRLVEELLFLARADQDANVHQESAVFDLVEIALRSIDASTLVGPSWPLDLDGPEHVWCRGSEIEIRRVFDNLLSNIRTHTPPGTPGSVTISENAGAITVVVEDEGPGIATVDGTRLFDRFWRGDSSRARATGSTGLGLSIVRAIIDQHSGNVSASPRSPCGTSVTITLPAAVRAIKRHLSDSRSVSDAGLSPDR